MENFIISIIPFLILYAIGSRMEQKSRIKLNSNKREQLSEIFSRHKIIIYLVSIIPLILVTIGILFELIEKNLGFKIYTVFVIVLLVLLRLLNSKILKLKNYPESYITSYLKSTTVIFVGLIVYIFLLIWLNENY